MGVESVPPSYLPMYVRVDDLVLYGSVSLEYVLCSGLCINLGLFPLTLWPLP